MGNGVETVGFFRFLGECLDNADTGQRVGQHRIERGGTSPLLGVHSPQLGKHEFEDTDDDRNGNEDDERQLPVQDQTDDRQTDVVDHVNDKRRNLVDEESADDVGVIVDTGNQTTGLIGVEVGQGQALHAGEDIHLHCQRDAGRHVGIGTVAPDTESQRQHRGTEDQRDGNPYHVHAEVVELTGFRDDVVIKEQTGDQRADQRNTGGRKHDEQDDGNTALVVL